MGTTQLLSVPFALYAEDSGSSVDSLDNMKDVSVTGAFDGQVLKFSGGQWVAGTDNTSSSSGGVNVTPRFKGDGTSGNPLDINQQGATNGQVLKWNGTSWAPASDNNTTYSAGTGISLSGTTINSVWTVNGKDIHNNNTGFVGIGITSPLRKFHVTNSDGQLLRLENTSSSTTNIDVEFARAGSNDWIIRGGAQSSGQFQIRESDDNFSTSNLLFSIAPNTGLVGIGDITPLTKLDVDGVLTVRSSATNTATDFGPGKYSKDNSVLAWGFITGSGTISGTNKHNIKSVVKNSTGNYTITLETPATLPTFLIPQAYADTDSAPTTAASQRIVSVNVISNSYFKVYITNGSFTPVDNDFTFVVFGK